MGDARYGLLLDEALRQLDVQLRDVDQLRVRASWLISAAAVSTSFLGGGLIRVQAIEALGWVALTLFAATVGLALWALASPLDEMPAGFSPTTIERDWIRANGLSDDDLRLNLALRIETAVQANEVRVDLRRDCLTVAAVALAAEIAIWLIQLG